VFATQVAATAGALDLRARHDAHGARTVQPRTARRQPRHLACDRRNYDVAAQRCVLSRIRVEDAEHVARELNERVLETAARAEEWHVARARKLDASEHAEQTFVRTSWRRPQAVERFEAQYAVSSLELERRHPRRFDAHAELCCRME